MLSFIGTSLANHFDLVLDTLAAVLVCTRPLWRCAPRRARTAARRERRRIARELHDVLGHRLLMIAMHARQLPGLAAQTRPVADAIDETVRTTLEDVRRAIGVLRSDDSGEAAPPDGTLSSEMVDLGGRLPSGRLSIRLDNLEQERHVPDGVRLTVLRIVQEGLTNALKHSKIGPIHVALRFGNAEVVVSVVSGTERGVGTMPGPVREGHGYGLRGLRERVSEHGGSFECGPIAGGGFVLRARLPVPISGQRPDAKEETWMRSAS